MEAASSWALPPPHPVSGEPRLGGCTVHFADKLQGLRMQEDSCWGLSLGTLQGLHANEPPLGLFCKRQGADTPTLRICCAPPPTDPVELARKWEEQVMGTLKKRVSRPPHAGVCGMGGRSQDPATPL